jgi:acetylornithine deacetylase
MTTRALPPGDDPVAVLASLVAIDSENPGLAEGGAGEAAIADACAAWLGDRGFEVHRLDRRGGRPSIVAIARGSGGGRSLMLNGHLDTVGLAGYDGDPLDPVVRDGSLFGRGAFDMKGGIAAMLAAAARATARSTPQGDVLLALVADEEHASFGTEEVLERFTTDAAIVCEPTQLEVVRAHKGFAWFDIEVIGRAAHGSRPDLGIDAITKAGHVLVALQRLQAQLASGAAHPVLGTGSIHAGRIAGGVEPSTYPERCRITVERRTVPGESGATVEAELRAMLEGVAATVADLEWRLLPGLARDPWEADREADVYRAVLARAGEALGRPPVERGEAFWTDAQLLGQAGIPALLFGASGGGAHAATEWAEVDSVRTLTDVLQRVIVDLCG